MSAARTLICLVTLIFDLFCLKLMRIIARGFGKLPTNFGFYGTFRSQLMGQHPSYAPRDIATLTFDPGGHGASR